MCRFAGHTALGHDRDHRACRIGIAAFRIERGVHSGIGDDNRLTAGNHDAVVAFERVVDASDVEREIFDLKIVLGMDAVIVFGNHDQRTFATDFKINV